jgi:hypothetical protein
MTIVVDDSLSPLQIRVYAAITSCWSTYGQSPSQYELQVACRCSNTAIQNALKALRDRGHIIAPKFGVRSLKPVDLDRRVLKEEPDPFSDLIENEKYWKDQA